MLTLPMLDDIDANEPAARFCNSFNLARTKDTLFIDVCKHAGVNAKVAALKAAKHQELNNAL